MAWYWFALLAGLVLPWVVMPRTILVGFGSGVQTGLGAWAGMCIVTLPVMFVIMYLFHLFIG